MSAKEDIEIGHAGGATLGSEELAEEGDISKAIINKYQTIILHIKIYLIEM